VVIFLLSGCSAPGDGGSIRPASSGSATIRVPQDAKTIQDAVSAARDGDLVLVAPGTYRETVQLKTPNVVLRGTQRDGVIIDGEVRRANGIVVTAPGVAVENLTVRGHTLNGVLVTGLSDSQGGIARGSDGYQHLDPAAHPALQGFRVSYVTASNNGLYGIYAFDAQHGVIENSYASGSADSGIYVGQCKPCHIVVRGNIAERNAVGYEGTNASGEMFVLGNRFVGNRVGLTSNSDYQEAFVPQQDATIAGNLIAANAEPLSPAQADGAFGLGVGIAGGTRNLVTRNRVTGNPGTGLALGSTEDLPPVDNRVLGNVLTGNGVDLAYTASSRAPGSRNCLQDNEIGTATPPQTAACLSGPGLSLPRNSAPPGIPFTTVAAPPKQPELPDAVPAPAKPAQGLPGTVEVNVIAVPPPDFLAAQAGVRP
jgi:hypothetical protein